MFQQLRIYNDSLFTNFSNEIGQLLTKNSDEELAAKLKLICVTSHPISNVDIDRTFEMLEVLDFHFGITEKSQAEWPWQKREKLG